MKNCKIVFVSNYLNHHQIPFCNAMYGLLGGAFAFVQTEPMEQERVSMGWQEENAQPYLKLYYEEPEICRKLIEDCEVAIFGGTDEESYIRPRMEIGKPVIRYSERLYKTGQWKAVSPRGLRKKYSDHTRYRKGPFYLLCAGAYVPSDFHIVRAYPGKMLKWGYFPETRHYDVDKLMREKGWTSGESSKPAKSGRPVYLLWAARMIDWKHPELPLKIARYLKDKGCFFHLDMVGGGELEPEMRRLISQYGIENEVSLRGYCAPAQVRSLMERADIYLATSDRQEGWGAVINEAMNSGCAVVADHMMGAVPYLIRHGENGLIYEDGNEKKLFELTEQLVQSRELCEKLGRSAVRTITEEWNSENAAKRLAVFCIARGFLDRSDVQPGVLTDVPVGEAGFTESGPCSIAPVISEHKMYRLLTEERM